MTTEDEATRLLKGADPARVDDDAPFVDAADYLAALRTRSTTVTLIDPEPNPPQPESHHWPIIAVAAAAIVAIGIGGLVIATRNDDPTGGVAADQPTTVAQPTTTVAQTTTTVAQPAAVAQPPVEVSMCNMPGPEIEHGTEENVVVSLPDGEMTIQQRRDQTWTPILSSVTDPRLSGTVYHTSNADVYTLPGNEAGPDFAVATVRIENDEGAWQGSLVQLAFPDGTEYVSPMVMTGEGAYEGLTAIVANVDPPDDCTMEGYIIDGTIPPAPEPQTGGGLG